MERLEVREKGLEVRVERLGVRVMRLENKPPTPNTYPTNNQH